MCASILPFALACLLTITPLKATKSEPDAYTCEGNACSQVSLACGEEGQKFHVENNSDRRVKVEVKTYAGSSSVRVESRKTDYLQVKYFNGPYHANYE